MRIRQIKPAFWADPPIQKELGPAEREFYIGLWMLADDGGWLRVDVVEIAGELYRYEPTKRREAAAHRYLERLAALGRVELAACGRHALIPTLTRHQRFAGPTKRVYTITIEHRVGCLGLDDQAPAGFRGSPPDPGPVRDGQEPVSSGQEQVSWPIGRDQEIRELRKIASDPDLHQLAREKAKQTLRRYGVDVTETIDPDYPDV